MRGASGTADGKPSGAKQTLSGCATLLVVGAVLYFTFQGCALSCGRDLELLSKEVGFARTKWHWRDRRTGECFFSYELETDTLIKEKCPEVKR